MIGAVTTAWDSAHAVIATMGDRFVLLRMDSTRDRTSAGRRAIANTGSEDKMRAELATAVADVLAGASRSGIELNDEETGTLLAAADLVTLARTGVEFNYRGDVIDAHAPEMPTRFAKQLAQVVRGGVAVGMLRDGCDAAGDQMRPRLDAPHPVSHSRLPRTTSEQLHHRSPQGHRQAARHRRPAVAGAAHARGGGV